jgi:hypothetical protein
MSLLMADKRTLKWLAAITWTSGAVSLLAKGAHLLVLAGSSGRDLVWLLASLTAGFALGSLKAKLILFKSCRQNLTRIGLLTSPRWWQFYTPLFFLLLVLMIVTGLVLSSLVQDSFAGQLAMAVVTIGMGSALMFSSIAFFEDAA